MQNTVNLGFSLIEGEVSAAASTCQRRKTG
jgi:hypothetical protein